MRPHAGSLVWGLGVLSAALALTLSAWPAYNEGWQACQGMGMIWRMIWRWTGG